MAQGIGKIVLGKQRAQSLYSKASSRAPMLEYGIGNQKRGEDRESGMAILTSLAGISSAWGKNMKSWDKFDAGAKASGIDTGEAPDWMETAKRGLGISKVDLSKTYELEGGSRELTGASVQAIGERKLGGTLESFLEGKEIGDVFGSKTKGYQAFEQFGKEGQEWGQYRDKTLLGKGIGTAPNVDDVPYNQKTMDIMNRAKESGYGGGKDAPDYKSLVSDTYGTTVEGKPKEITEISREQWEKKVMDESYKTDESFEDARYRESLATLAPGRGPKDPLAAERQRYQEGIVAREADEVMGGDPESWGGNFEQGSTIEDMWTQDKNVPFRKPDVPMATGENAGRWYGEGLGAEQSYGFEEQPDTIGEIPLSGTPEHFQQQLTSDASPGYQMDAGELATIQPEAQRLSTMSTADAAGQPIDPMLEQRQNVETNQLGQKNPKSLEDVLKLQDELAALLKPKQKTAMSQVISK